MNREEAVEKSIATLDDLRDEYPDLLESVGKPENVFAFGGEKKDEAFAIKVMRSDKDTLRKQLTGPMVYSLFSYTNNAWKELQLECRNKTLID